jgi:hypothetical protein
MKVSFGAQTVPLSVFILHPCTCILILKDFPQVRHPQHLVMSDAPDPHVLAATINDDTLNREISVVCDDADKPRGCRSSMTRISPSEDPVRMVLCEEG